MYNPTRFRVTDHKFIRELVENYSFATLLLKDDADISVSHLPFIYDESVGEYGQLIGHMARANPQWRLFAAGQPAKVIFHGPHAYITPRWYTPAPDNVPTWNYAVVHMNGAPRIVDEPELAYQKMKELVKHFDPNWSLALADHDRQVLMSGVVVFEINITSIDAKFKLSQNQVEANRSAVIRELSASSNQVDRETSQLMART